MELGSAHGGGTAGSRVGRRDLERVCVCVEGLLAEEFYAV